MIPTYYTFIGFKGFIDFKKSKNEQVNKVELRPRWMESK